MWIRKLSLLVLLPILQTKCSGFSVSDYASTIASKVKRFVGDTGTALFGNLRAGKSGVEDMIAWGRGGFQLHPDKPSPLKVELEDISPHRPLSFDEHEAGTLYASSNPILATAIYGELDPDTAVAEADPAVIRGMLKVTDVDLLQRNENILQRNFDTKTIEMLYHRAGIRVVRLYPKMKTGYPNRFANAKRLSDFGKDDVKEELEHIKADIQRDGRNGVFAVHPHRLTLEFLIGKEATDNLLAPMDEDAKKLLLPRIPGLDYHGKSTFELNQSMKDYLNPHDALLADPTLKPVIMYLMGHKRGEDLIDQHKVWAIGENLVCCPKELKKLHPETLGSEELDSLYKSLFNHAKHAL